jgi:aminopeptidase N
VSLLRSAAVATVVGASLLTSCGSARSERPDPTASASPSGAATSGGTGVLGDLAAAESEPTEDSVYPDVGDPSVDALHYDLDLTWDRSGRRLEGHETLEFRATTTGDHVQLDLGEPLTVGAVTLDGAPVTAEHVGKNLIVHADVEADEVYTLELDYAGSPEPVRAPTTRQDFSTTGWTVADSGSVWTMQEPYGAFTWYAVNDQPSDKALYDFTVRVAAPWVGVTNGTMTSREVVDGQTVTSFHLDDPAAAYLITIAIGDYAVRRDRTAGGTPVALWALRSRRAAFPELRYAAEAIEWIEGKLGPYPFASAGIVLTESTSGMETQTLVTLGDTRYIRSKPVIVHELIHQWYGDLVTPRDWSDLWMNEGMTTYLQLVYEAEQAGGALQSEMDNLRTYDQQLRDASGPPADYDATMFGDGNVYYCPALMWHELRGLLGEEEFWRLTREWPRAAAYANADRDQLTSWWSEQSGRDLTEFFASWLDGKTTPRRS